MKASKVIPIIVLLAILVLALPAATGCGDSSGDSSGGSAGSGQSVDLGLDTVILTVDDSPCYWPEFLYWLRFLAGYYEDQNGLDAITDWDAQVNGKPLKEFFLSSAVDYVGRHRALEVQAKKMGFTVTDAQKQEMAAARAQNVSVYGSEAEYVRIVRQTYVTEDVYNYLLEIGYLSTDVFSELYGPAGEKCSDADVAAYVAQKGLLCARFVFLSNTAPNGDELSDDEKTANRQKLQGLVDQLKASSDVETLFAGFVSQYNEDTASSGFTDGVLFTADQMPAEFMAAYNQLQDKQYSGVVETKTGLYLMLREPVRPDMIGDQAGNTLRYRAAYEYLFEKQVDAWYADMKVKYTKAYDSLDLEKLFGSSTGSATTSAPAT
jgi:hypothetical protein